MDREAARRGGVDGITIGGDLLIATGWLDADESVSLRARVRIGDEELALQEFEVVRMTRGDAPGTAGDANGRRGFVLLGELMQEPPPGDVMLAFEWTHGRADLTCPSGRSGLPAILAAIAAAPPAERQRVRAVVERRIGKFAHGTDDLPRPEQLDPRIRAHVDRACSIPGKGVFLYGWIADPTSQLHAVQLVDANGTGPDLLEHAARHDRPDVDRAFPELAGASTPPGLIAFVEVELDDGPEARIGELLFVTRAGKTAMLSFPIEDPVGGAVRQLELLLAPLRPEGVDAAELLSAHVGPAIEARWRARRPPATPAREYTFGVRPTRPSCSIVVPLYGRYDFLMYQLSLFAHDPDLSAVDLVYVIDDESIREATIRLAREVAPLWPVPFRLLDLGRNFGYAGATNAGARVTDGELLLLLNSDVLPDRPGWLGRLCAKHRSLPRCGALAPRLLYEDGSIQHDGIAFVRHPRAPAIWINDHPGKGLPPSLAPPPGDVEVPAVTGACMLVRRETFLELGGLDEEYIVGDFEDSDLCLRLRERGLASYVARGETLFHLERQSQSRFGHAEWRAKLTLYNAWRHTRRWQDTLTELEEAGSP